MTRADILMLADLCAMIIRDKMSDAQIRKSGRIVSSDCILPDSQRHSQSAYVRLIRQAKGLPDHDALSRQALIDLAYEVGRDLCANVPPVTIEKVDALRDLLSRRSGGTLTHTLDTARLSTYSRRVDIYDRDGDGEAA